MFLPALSHTNTELSCQSLQALGTRPHREPSISGSRSREWESRSTRPGLSSPGNEQKQGKLLMRKKHIPQRNCADDKSQYFPPILPSCHTHIRGREFLLLSMVSHSAAPPISNERGQRKSRATSFGTATATKTLHTPCDTHDARATVHLLLSLSAIVLTALSVQKLNFARNRGTTNTRAPRFKYEKKQEKYIFSCPHTIIVAPKIAESHSPRSVFRSAAHATGRLGPGPIRTAREGIIRKKGTQRTRTKQKKEAQGGRKGDGQPQSEFFGLSRSSHHYTEKEGSLRSRGHLSLKPPPSDNTPFSEAHIASRLLGGCWGPTCVINPCPGFQLNAHKTRETCPFVFFVVCASFRAHDRLRYTLFRFRGSSQDGPAYAGRLRLVCRLHAPSSACSRGFG